MKYLSLVVTLLAISACTKTITPVLNNGPVQLNIEGAISDTAGPYFVSITNTVGFYEDNNYPGVSGADVTITDSTIHFTDLLKETSAGLYVTSQMPTGIPGHTYILQVNLSGKSYTASSTMPQPVLLDSVTFDSTDIKSLTAVANYQDPRGVSNYYKYTLTVNNLVKKRFQTFSDRLSDGKYIRENIDSDTSEILHHDEVRIALVSIDKNVYTYLNEAEQISYSNDNLIAPATPVSNITGGCLGYFSAQTVSSKQGNVK